MEMKRREEVLIQNFPYFLFLTIGYALFYVFCLFKNGSGITFPLYTLGTMIYFILVMKKLEIKLKKSSYFYLVSVILLGISTCLTDSWVIIFLNKFSICFLIIVFLLCNFYESEKWNFLEHLKGMIYVIFVSIGFIYKPFSHMMNYLKRRVKKEKKSNFTYILLGIIIALPITLIVLLLLSSADAVFGNIFEYFFKEFSIFKFVGNGILCTILFLFAFFGSYMLVSFLCNHNLDNGKEIEAKGEPIIAITISSILSFIYVIFCSIQIVYLFIGSSGLSLSLPDGMTYAEYAREGFFQLLFVCILNLILVLFGVYGFKESKILKVFLCIITSCTYIMIASSAMRMLLYIQYKYLTFLRVFVLWALLVILLVMMGVMITIFKKDFNFFKYSTLIVTILYIILSFARVDYFVAKVNVDNMKKETQYAFFEGTDLYDDTFYLTFNLSYDAAPAVIDYLKDKHELNDMYSMENSYTLNIMYDTRNMGIRDFNVSRFIARNLAKEITEP